MKIEVSEAEAVTFWQEIKHAIDKARMDGRTMAQAVLPNVLAGSREHALTMLAEAFVAYKAGEKITAIKKIREATGCGLKEAKDVVEGNPHGTV